MGIGIYEEPNESSNVAVMLRDSTVVKVLGTVNRFYKIQFNGDQIGYVDTGNVVFNEKLAGNPTAINKVAYISDIWSNGPVDVFEYSGATTPEAVLTQDTKVGYLGTTGNIDYIAFGPNYDEIGVVNIYMQLGETSPEATLKNGIRVAVLEQASSGYYYIAFGEDYSEAGVVSSKYLSFIKETSTAKISSNVQLTNTTRETQM